MPLQLTLLESSCVALSLHHKGSCCKSFISTSIPCHKHAQEQALYALVLLTIEFKSNFYSQLRQSWIQAHLRLSLSQAMLPGGGCWEGLLST